MENLKTQIVQKLKLIEEMIEKEENRNKIEEQRKELDKFLERYLGN